MCSMYLQRHNRFSSWAAEQADCKQLLAPTWDPGGLRAPRRIFLHSCMLTPLPACCVALTMPHALANCQTQGGNHPDSGRVERPDAERADG